MKKTQGVSTCLANLFQEGSSCDINNDYLMRSLNSLQNLTSLRRFTFRDYLFPDEESQFITDLN